VVVENVLGKKVDKFVEVVRRGGDELLIVPTPGWVGDEKVVEVVKRGGDELLIVPTTAGWVGDELLIVPRPVVRMGDGLLVLFDPRSMIRSFDKPLNAAVERPGEKERL
jgi:predicted metal-dependent TIM-barrel fold hydrolase